MAAALKGRTVRGSGRKGKHVWLELDRRPWPAFHMGMSGWFEVIGPDDVAPRFWKLDLLAGNRRVVFCDVRRFGRVRQLHPRVEDVPHLAVRVRLTAASPPPMKMCPCPGCPS